MRPDGPRRDRRTGERGYYLPGSLDIRTSGLPRRDERPGSHARRSRRRSPDRRRGHDTTALQTSGEARPSKRCFTLLLNKIPHLGAQEGSSNQATDWAMVRSFAHHRNNHQRDPSRRTSCSTGLPCIRARVEHRHTRGQLSTIFPKCTEHHPRSGQGRMYPSRETR